MSELQLGLILFGVLVVVGVYLFNRFQERQFRRRMESSFRERPADILLEPAGARGADEERIEPRVGTAGDPSSVAPERRAAQRDDITPAQEPTARTEPVTVTHPHAPSHDGAPTKSKSPIDYVCDIAADEAVSHGLVLEFFKSACAIGKPVSIMGWDSRASEWVALPCGQDAALTRIQAGLQLADRSGPANRVQLSSMRDLVHEFAERIGGTCQCPEIDEAAHAAAEIDRFCAKVDISIGCNVIPTGSGGLQGTKVRGLLESAGFTLESSGRFALRAEDGSLLMSVESIDGETLSAERLRAAPLPGLTLTMDVPRVATGARAFDRMIEIGRHLAQALDAAVVDDNRAQLTDSGVKLIRQQLRAVHAAMEAQGIPAGGALAARLFS